MSGYPTIKWFRKGIAYDYEGERTADGKRVMCNGVDIVLPTGLVTFARQRADPNWEPPPDEVMVLSQSNFTDVATATELLLVEFYAPWYVLVCLGGKGCVVHNVITYGLYVIHSKRLCDEITL